jgi:hypothetical protein
LFITALLAVALSALPSLALGNHSWGGYHWARTSNPFNLKVGDNVTGTWDAILNTTVTDWTASSVLNLTKVPGGTRAKPCKATTGRVEVCNASYGNNGWLGIAGISIDSNGHITTGYTKLNDFYFSLDYYDDPLWKQSVTCQELGHNLGLDHQDEDFDNESLNTCMDYQDPPTEDPNTHDYQQLSAIYGHLDTYDSYATGDGGGGGGGCNAPPGKGCNKSGFAGEVGWGASLGRRGNAETFIRIDPDGTMHLTHVTWAIGH